MADDLSGLRQIQTQGVTRIFSKPEGRQRKRQEFARHLKEDEESEQGAGSGESGTGEQAPPKPHHQRGAPRGKLIDYEA